MPRNILCYARGLALMYVLKSRESRAISGTEIELFRSLGKSEHPVLSKGGPTGIGSE